MAHYRLTNKADADLAALYEFGIFNFGLSQAQSYLLDLHDRFHSLTESPLLGREASQFAAELRRFEYQAHVIFYLPEDKGILVVRVLGNKMDFERHF